VVPTALKELNFETGVSVAPSLHVCEYHAVITSETVHISQMH